VGSLRQRTHRLLISTVGEFCGRGQSAFRKLAQLGPEQRDGPQT
jgi:hypothetical protein